MNKNNKDSLGDRIKSYENQICGIKLLPRIPIIARLDIRAGHTFCKGLNRPFDNRFVEAMIETSKFLVKETNANIAYTQSDEITLLWYTENIDSQMFFGGRVFKILSLLPSMASVYFNKMVNKLIPEKNKLSPIFDCRVFNVPTLDEAVNCFYWRELDATKNSITMAARYVYSDKEIFQKNSSEKQEMLFKKGINWNDYADSLKRGTYIQRKRKISTFSMEELNRLPDKHNAKKDPNYVMERWCVERLYLPPISKIKNKIEVLVYGKDYEME